MLSASCSGLMSKDITMLWMHGQPAWRYASLMRYNEVISAKQLDLLSGTFSIFYLIICLFLIISVGAYYAYLKFVSGELAGDMASGVVTRPFTGLGAGPWWPWATCQEAAPKSECQASQVGLQFHGNKHFSKILNVQGDDFDKMVLRNEQFMPCHHLCIVCVVLATSNVCGSFVSTGYHVCHIVCHRC